MIGVSFKIFHYRHVLRKHVLERCVSGIRRPAKSNAKSEESNSGEGKPPKSGYRKTLNLPKTTFPLSMKDGAAAKREMAIQKICNFKELYSWQRKQRQREFIMHDGPPYANGDPHVGHALNKILKDITTRFKVLTGHSVHYIPGWDCHGMPIEQKALANIRLSHTDMDPLDIRQKARDFASTTVNVQRNAFKRWGVMADWDGGCYFTFDKSYVTKQLDVFYEMYKNGVVYQDYMPVFWSPSSRTALAEAELEYNEHHKSTSVYVRFPISALPESLKCIEGLQGPCWAVIWTTTPWTLPANRAISYGPGIKYSFVKLGSTGDTYLICSNFIERFCEMMGEVEILTTVPGNQLDGAAYIHPMYKDMECPLLSGDHVTVEKGTGLVHTAPAHGPEDFQVALKHGLSIECHVDENGRYKKEVGPELYGKSVLDDATEAVLTLMSDSIIQQESFEHSYPYDWRSKKPVILRASSQWFVNTNLIKKRAMECLCDVEIRPQSSEKGMASQLERRTYWCISRQRVWGVPLPVFYRQSDGKPLISRASVDHIKLLVEEHGTNFWWTLTTNELLPRDIIKESGFDPDDSFTRGNDILDIWFDSGCSWAAVLQGKQADVYMEGLDQFGGWFQSSLLTCVAAQDKPPYKALVVHGFAVDEDGKKMSKSIGNVVDPQVIINGGKGQPAYGADVLRWWAAHSGLEVNVTIGPSVIQSCHEHVFRVRKAVRFLMGNLNDFSPGEHLVPYKLLLPIDQYMLHLFSMFTQQVRQAYEDYNFSKVVRLIEKFVSTDVSSFHCHVTKDRLYCSPAESRERRSAQTVQYLVLQGLLQAIAPILPHLAEEAFLASQPNGLPVTDSIFKQSWTTGEPEWSNPKLADLVNVCFDFRNSFYSVIGSDNPEQFDVMIYTTPVILEQMKVLQDVQCSCTSQLVEVLQSSQASLTSEVPEDIPFDARPIEENSVALEGETHKYLLVIQPTKKAFCDRCRRYTSDASGEICKRCANSLSEGWDR